MHVSTGSMQSLINTFQNGASKVSAHYGVGKDGSVVQFVKEQDTAFHAGTVVRPSWALLRPGTNPNFHTIGIEHEGKGGPEPWPQPQLDASRRLVADIARRWDIPLDAAHLPLHNEIRSDKGCPGEGFDRASFLQRIRNQGSVPSRPNNLQVVAIATVNLRLAATTASVVKRRLPAGTVFVVTASTAGETVRGNSLWYQVDEELFLWSGGTDRPGG